MIGILGRLLLIVACGCAVSAAAAAESPVQRTILALYDSHAEHDLVDTRIHRYAEAPLNYLGLRLKYHDIAGGLPPRSSMDGVRGVLSWYAGTTDVNVVDYVRWMATTVAEGRSFVIFGDPGIRLDGLSEADAALARRFTSALGFLWTGRYRPGPYDIAILAKDPAMVEDERRLAGPLPGFFEFKQPARGSTSYLKVRLGKDETTESHLVVTGERGGMVAAGYEIYTDPRLGFTQWRLDPFAFFRVAFATDDLPKLDPTTVSGRRAFYALVDGDGWRDVTSLPRYRKNSTVCAEVVFDTILRRYADIPITVAPIAGDLDDGWYGSEKAREIARRIAALPNVEIASHTFSHPFVWSHYRDGSAEEATGKSAAKSAGSLLIGTEANPEVFWRDRQRQLRAAGNAMPGLRRAYANAPYDLATEISGSIAVLDALFEGQKRVTLLTWSGDTRPYESALAAADTAGVAHINGGISGYDRPYLSIANTSPIGLRVGGHYQVYGANDGEATYSNRPGDSLPGASYLTSVLNLTEIPRRLRPAEVYWQMYAAQDFDSLNGVLTQLDLVQRLELAPVTTATYARMASGFDAASIIKIGDGVWRIEGRSALSTIRFDNALSLAVDFTKSRGVIGQRHYQGSLYVHLDGAEPAPVVALSGESNGGGAPPLAARAYLVHGRWGVEGLTTDERGFEFTTLGFGIGDMVWQVPDGGNYEIAVKFADGSDWHGTAVATSDRLIRFAPPASPAHQARVRVDRRSGQS